MEGQPAPSPVWVPLLKVTQQTFAYQTSAFPSPWECPSSPGVPSHDPSPPLTHEMAPSLTRPIRPRASYSNGTPDCSYIIHLVLFSC